MGEVLAGSEPCSFDSFSKAFVSKLGLVSMNAQGALRLLAHMLFLDIVQVEQRHAALRKRAKVMAPTNVPKSKDVGAHFTLRQFRLRNQNNHSSGADTLQPQHAGGTKKGRTPKVHRKLKFAGGAWRAFIRLRSRGQEGNADFRAMAAEYRALSMGEKTHLVKLGKLATRSGRLKTSGQTSFGPTSLRVKRQARVALRHQQALRALRETDLTESALVDNTLAVTQCSWANIEEMRKVARSQSRQ